MASSSSSHPIAPRIIIHGGAGNVSRATLPPSSLAAYRASLTRILHLSHTALLSNPHATALDVATYAVSLFEDDALFNAARGAVFTRAGTNELEASVMVSSGHHKRGTGCMLLRHVKNPIKLAREILIRGDDVNGNGAQGHVQLSGEYVEGLAREWGLEMVEPDYFFTQRRWDEHLKGLSKGDAAATANAAVVASTNDDNDPSWDGHEYLPQGTVGAVVLDRHGTICTATSTGGLTNKLPGRIGDTPTLGAGFWAEEWAEDILMSYQPPPRPPLLPASSPLDKLLSRGGDVAGILADCLPSLMPPAEDERAGPARPTHDEKHPRSRRHAVGLSGTGNGDSFLRTAAARTVAAMQRFGGPGHSSLAEALRRVAGPGGELERSAGERWGRSGEGAGGFIGIELVGDEGKVEWDLNCGGMFRAWVDDGGRERVAVFADEDGKEGWEEWRG